MVREGDLLHASWTEHGNAMHGRLPIRGYTSVQCGETTSDKVQAEFQFHKAQECILVFLFQFFFSPMSPFQSVKKKWPTPLKQQNDQTLFSFTNPKQTPTSNNYLPPRTNKKRPTPSALSPPLFKEPFPPFLIVPPSCLARFLLCAKLSVIILSQLQALELEKLAWEHA